MHINRTSKFIRYLHVQNLRDWYNVQVSCVVTAQEGGRCSTVHTVVQPLPWPLLLLVLNRRNWEVFEKAMYIHIKIKELNWVKLRTPLSSIYHSIYSIQYSIHYWPISNPTHSLDGSKTIRPKQILFWSIGFSLYAVGVLGFGQTQVSGTNSLRSSLTLLVSVQLASYFTYMNKVLFVCSM